MDLPTILFIKIKTPYYHIHIKWKMFRRNSGAILTFGIKIEWFHKNTIAPVTVKPSELFFYYYLDIKFIK